ncbi:MAG: hypothetical protein ACE15C_05065 [Phycisphaerae bacterium]
MNSSRWLLCGLLAACIAMGQAIAADPATTKASREGQKPRKENLPGFWGIMAGVVTMTDDQQAKVKEKLAAEKTALDQWKKDNGAKVEDAQKALKAAQEARDKDAVNKAREQLKTLNDDEARIKANTMKDVLALLSDEQRLAWFTYTLVDASPQGAKVHFKAAEMTDDQVKQAKDLAKDSAKLLASGKDAGGKDLDQKSTREIYQKFYDLVKDKVLTAEQKKKMDEARTTSRPTGSKPAAPK